MIDNHAARRHQRSWRYIALTVFGGMLFVWASTRAQTRASYTSTEPASATIVLDEAIEADRMAVIARMTLSRPGVLEVTERTQFASRVEVNGQSRVAPLLTFVAAPDDPMRMVRFDVGRPGSWPPSPGEIFVKADSLVLLGAAVGDTVTIEAPGGQPTRLRVAGAVYAPAWRPRARRSRATAICQRPRWPPLANRPGSTS